MEIKTSVGNGSEEEAGFGKLRLGAEKCIDLLSSVRDAGDLTVLIERVREILLLTEELEGKGKAYMDILLKKRSVAEQYSRLTIKG